ncbi:MAG: 4-hydroxy-2-oxovalerate aldolase, partial [Peptococcaceae bacterium]|nr:4-hydroxy-2-oxovalerate aldolase [Peptococcaceae bacterium]
MRERIRVIDTTLRDGSHSLAHQYSAGDIGRVAAALERAGLDTIEVTHGDGLGGSSIQYGRARITDREALRAARAVLCKTMLAVLLLPGIGVKEDLETACAEGARVVRVATHVTEADISAQHMTLAKQTGMEVIGFLMLAHMEPAQKVLEQARLMESYGADVVYVVDSDGAMLPDD